MVTRPKTVDAHTIAEKIRELAELLERWHPTEALSDAVDRTHRGHCSGCGWSGPDRTTKTEAESDARQHEREVGA